MKAAIIATGLMMAFLSAPAAALSLRIEPVLIDLKEPAAASKLTLRNQQNVPVNIQARVFKWVQDKSGDHLHPTDDVVVSPPMTTLSPGSEYVLRIVRLKQTPVIREESYRVFVDELPPVLARSAGTVSFAIRQSIPIFFGPAEPVRPNVNWAVIQRRDEIVLRAVNSGERRLRVSNLSLSDGSGRPLLRRRGLVGYVLSGSATQWSFTSKSGRFRPGNIRMNAESDIEPINVSPATLSR